MSEQQGQHRTHPSGRTQPYRCALCGSLCEVIPTRWVLQDHDGRRAYICVRCVEGGPPQAARELRRRAARARRLAERCRPFLYAWGWTGLHRLLHEYAAALDGQAERVARLPGW